MVLVTLVMVCIVLMHGWGTWLCLWICLGFAIACLVIYFGGCFGNSCYLLGFVSLLGCGLLGLLDYFG